MSDRPWGTSKLRGIVITKENWEFIKRMVLEESIKSGDELEEDEG